MNLLISKSKTNFYTYISLIFKMRMIKLNSYKLNREGGKNEVDVNQ